MITISGTGKSRGFGRNKKTICELRGLSTDKSELVDEVNGIKFDNGSVFIEIDTGKIYMYNLDNTTWVEI